MQERKIDLFYELSKYFEDHYDKAGYSKLGLNVNDIKANDKIQGKVATYYPVAKSGKDDVVSAVVAINSFNKETGVMKNKFKLFHFTYDWVTGEVNRKVLNLKNYFNTENLGKFLCKEIAIEATRNFADIESYLDEIGFAQEEHNKKEENKNTKFIENCMENSF